ncbi:MAG: hypothetical protein HYW93_07510, partial [Thaumarchaeota archaeon]|nr:hypothetical protein [Nitrososphaerota archaeon]
MASLVINFAISPGTSTSLSLDKASYGPTEIIAIATLVDPDLNDSSGTQTLTKAGNHTLKIGSSTETGDSIGTFHLVALNTTTGTQHIVGGLYFRATALETSGTSATFTFTIPLSNFTVNSGDQIRVSYFRNFDSTRVNATASIGGATATVRFDRSDFPIFATTFAPGRRVNTTVVIVDPDRNLNPNAQETLEARLYPRNATDGTVGNKGDIASDTTLGTRKVNFYNITLTETGANTGNFTLKLLIEWGATNTAATRIANYSSPTKSIHNLDRTQDFIGGRLQVCVTDGLGPTTLEDVLIAGEGGSVTSVKGVCGAIIFAVHGATMVANITTGRMGTPVSLTLTEPDMNRDPSEKDKVLVNVEIYRGTTQPPEGVGVVCGEGKCNATYTLTETGTSTGVFTNSSTIGTGSGPFSIINASQFVRVRYMDDGSLGSQSVVGFTKSKPTANIVIGSTTGQLTVLPSVETGPFSTIVMTIVDRDHSFNKSRVTLDKVVSEVTSDEVNSIVANKANRTTGTFTFNVTVTHSTSPVTGDQLLQVNAADKIHVFYTDRLDSAGQVLIIEKVINVATRNGAIAADKANYIVGEFITVTVTDIDANRDSSLREFVRPVIVTDSWAVGTNITLQETSEASGVFVGQVQVIEGFPGAGQVLGRIGDAVTIRYID